MKLDKWFAHSVLTTLRQPKNPESPQITFHQLPDHHSFTLAVMNKLGWIHFNLDDEDYPRSMEITDHGLLFLESWDWDSEDPPSFF